MDIIIAIFAIGGLSFLIKDSAGPFDVMDKLRNLMMRNQYVGVFFYKLLSCYFCVGCHCGWIVYLLMAEHYTWQFFTLYTLAGGMISLTLSEIRDRLTRV